MTAGPPPLRLAIAAESLTRWRSPRETLETIRALGCKDVQLCASLFPDPLTPSLPEAWELRRRLDGLGLRGDTLSLFPYRVPPALYADFLLRVARIAPVLGLRVMNVYLLPFLAADADEAATIDAFARALRAPLEAAAGSDLVFALEPEYFDASRNVRGLRRILQAVDHPRFAITFDPCNLYQGGEEAFPYAYEELRERIVHVHLKNGGVFGEGRHPADEKAFPFAAPFADRSMRWGTLADGALNIRGIVARLIRDGYAGTLVLEPHAPDLARQLAVLADDLAFAREAIAAGSAPR